MMEKYGNKVYTIAADYNFGQISAEWVRKIVEENGGAMVGEEFIPLSVSQFGQTIQNIQQAKPDFVMTLLVGANQSSYYEQAAAAKLNLPMASSVNVAQAYEHKRFKAPALKDMYITANYMEEVDTPASNDFKQRFAPNSPMSPISIRKRPTPTMPSICTNWRSSAPTAPIRSRCARRWKAGISVPTARPARSVSILKAIT